MKPTTKTNYVLAMFFTLGLITGCNTLIAANQIMAADHMEVAK